MLGMAHEEARKHQPERHHQATPSRHLPLLGERQDAEPENQPEGEPVREKSPHRRTEQPRHDENHGAVGAILKVHEVRFAAVGPGIPPQQLAVPCKVGDEHVVGTEKAIRVPDRESLPEQELAHGARKDRDEGNHRDKVGKSTLPSIIHGPHTITRAGSFSRRRPSPRGSWRSRSPICLMKCPRMDCTPSTIGHLI